MNSTMSLTGSFDGRDFAEIIGLLSRRSCTGRLVVRSGSLHASIRLAEGSAVGLDVHNLHRRDESADWQAQLAEVCFEVLRSGRGTFEFLSDDGLGIGDGPGVRLGAIVTAAKRRLAKWREIESSIPTLNAVPVLSEGLRSEEMVVNQQAWRVVVAIDGRHSVAGLARRLDLDPLTLCQILKPLVEDGAVTIAGATVRTRSTPVRSVTIKSQVASDVAPVGGT